ncbi:MAG: menaquinone biosynthetic enzyme MqnA/MqnD family protein [Phycisphaerales bacterium]
MIRIGYVRYLNTVPLVYGLESWREAELHAAVPAKLGAMLTGDPSKGVAPEIDIGLVSLIDAARSPVDLAIVPVGMIGCDGPTLTVRLFSRVPLERVTTVHADTDSHTSVALCRVLLERRFGRRVALRDFDARERMALAPTGGTGEARSSGAAEADESEWPETLLLIGDKVVTDSPPAVRYPHQLDLGAAWREWTGLPFVYAAWMCRASEAEHAEIASAAAMLDRQRRRNVLRLDWLVDRCAPERGWPADLARAYVRDHLRFEIGAREREAVRRFLGECAELRIAPRREPAWIDPATMGVEAGVTVP